MFNQTAYKRQHSPTVTDPSKNSVDTRAAMVQKQQRPAMNTGLLFSLRLSSTHRKHRIFTNAITQNPVSLN